MGVTVGLVKRSHIRGIAKIELSPNPYRRLNAKCLHQAAVDGTAKRVWFLCAIFMFALSVIHAAVL